jgi:hypothetical protein
VPEGRKIHATKASAWMICDFTVSFSEMVVLNVELSGNVLNIAHIEEGSPCLVEVLCC